ncbi:low temperature requirement protein A [Nocardia sp. NPDC020380]|uniref:low temperature requirement protein A n=1 Tax=Nocardia sp. NPDC020380 TaxID=3364309 RepID=UPI0037A994DB
MTDRDSEPALRLPDDNGHEVSSLVPRRATWFELFGDLVFVAAIGQITHRVGTHPTAGSIAAAAGLFVPVWWAWVLYAVQANRADRDTVAHRLIAMAGFTGVVAMAVFAGAVGHTKGADAGFVLGYLCARAGVAALYALDARGEQALRRVFRNFTRGSLISAAGWLGGLYLLHGAPRYGVWAAAMVFELLLPLIVGRSLTRVAHEADHLRDRFGAFTIIVLGESVTGFTGGLTQARTILSAGLTGIAAFGVIACLWWTYFNASGTHPGAHAALDRGGKLLHAYTFGHLPLQLGLALTGASIGIAVSNGGRHLNDTAAACILGGVALFLAASALTRAAFLGFTEVVVLHRLITALLILALLPAAPYLPVALVLTALAALLATSVTLESPTHRRWRPAA